jgi:hypothetical protein
VGLHENENWKVMPHEPTTADSRIRPDLAHLEPNRTEPERIRK